MEPEKQINFLLEKYEVLNTQILLVPNWKWLALAIILSSGFVVKYIIHFVWIRLFNLAAKTKGEWDDELLKVVEPHVGKASVAIFWSYVIPLLKLGSDFEKFFLFGVKIFFAYALIMIVYSSVDIFVEIIKKSFSKKNIPIDTQVYQLLSKSLKVFVVIFGILVTIQNFGINVMSLLAGLGLGGLAFALAAQDTCANFFGSIMILLDRPFKVGDFIIVDGVEGTVEEVGFRSTKIRTFYNSQVIIPNGHLAKANVDNMGRRAYRRTLTHLGLEYSTSPEKMEAFINGVKEILKADDGVVDDNFHVAFDSYGDFSLNILLIFHVNKDDFAYDLKVKERVYLNIYKKAQEVGVEFAFPTQTLHLSKDAD